MYTCRYMYIYIYNDWLLFRGKELIRCEGEISSGPPRGPSRRPRALSSPAPGPFPSGAY